MGLSRWGAGEAVFFCPPVNYTRGSWLWGAVGGEGRDRPAIGWGLTQGGYGHLRWESPRPSGVWSLPHVLRVQMVQICLFKGTSAKLILISSGLWGVIKIWDQRGRTPRIRAFQGPHCYLCVPQMCRGIWSVMHMVVSESMTEWTQTSPLLSLSISLSLKRQHYLLSSSAKQISSINFLSLEKQISSIGYGNYFQFCWVTIDKENLCVPGTQRDALINVVKWTAPSR